MAADGSLKFDTKVDTSDLDVSISTLEKALDRFSRTVDKLSNQIAKGFKTAGMAATDTSKMIDSSGESAESVSKNVEYIGDAAEKTERQVKSLQEQMDAIDVQHWNDNEDMINASASERSVSVDNPEAYGYDKAAIEFIEQYGQKMADASRHANEFRQEIEQLQSQIKQLESQGLYFGDEEYDEAYLKLQKIEQALKDYKKELTSPTPDANPFGTDTIAGRVLDLQIQLQKLEESGKSLGNAEYDELYRKLAIAREEAKNYAAELAKTPKMIEKENQLLAEKQAKLEAAAQKEAQRQAAAQSRIDARIAKEEKLLQTQLAKSAQEAMEKQRLEEIASAAQASSEKVVGLRQELARLNARQADLEKAGLGLGYQEYDANAAQIIGINAQLSEYRNELTQSAEESNVFASVVKHAFEVAENTVAKFGKSLGDKVAGKVKQAVANLESIAKPADKASKSILKLSNMFKLMLIRMAMRATIQGVKEGMQNLVQYSSDANRSVSGLMSGMTYLKNSFATAFAPILTYVVPALNILINLLGTALSYISQFFSALGGGATFIRAKRVNEDYAKSLKATGSAACAAGKEAKKALAPFDDLVQIQQQETDGSSGGGGSGSVDPSKMFETAAIQDSIGDFANKLREMFEAGDWTGIGRLIGEKINEAVQSFTEYISWDNVGSKITAFVTAFTTMFNSLVATIDWYAIGIMIGTGINTLAYTLYLLLIQIDWSMLGIAVASGLSGMVHTVDWDLFGATIGAYFQAKIAGLYGFAMTADWAVIGLAISTCLMGMINQIDWGMLGLVFAASFSGIFATAENFAFSFDWTGFGSSIALSLSNFFQNFNWASAGTAASDIVLGLLSALLITIMETDWIAFGSGIATALENIDWLTVASRVWTVFWSAIAAVFAVFGSFLATLIIDGVTAAQEYFQGKIEECGGNVAAGIIKGINDAWAGIKTWVYNNIFTPFINAFKSAFGIHSPSTAMAEMGQYLWEGFCNGIKEFFSNPGDFIKANITDPFINSIKGLLGIHSPSTVLKEVGSDTVAGFNKGVEGGQASSQTVVQGWASGITAWFKSKFGISSGDSTEAQQWASGIMSGFNSSISQKYKNSQGVIETWAENIRKWFVASGDSKGVNQDSWKKFAGDIIMAFAEAITSKHIDTQLPIETWAENVRKWFVGESEAAGVNEISWAKFAEQVISAFKAKIEGSHAETQSPMEAWAKNVREWFWGDSNTEGVGGMYEAFYNMAKRINEGFAEGIHKFSYMAKDAIREWAREAMDEAEEEFDINSPSKEFATIAKYVVEGFNNGLLGMATSSRDAAQQWLDGVLDVFEGVDIRLPIGLDIPNAAAYLPRIAQGIVAPPRAGETASAMKGGSYGQEEAFAYLLEKMNEILDKLQADGDKPVQIVLNLTGNLASLARILKPELDKEAARRGVSLVVVGGT